MGLLGRQRWRLLKTMVLMIYRILHTNSTAQKNRENIENSVFSLLSIYCWWPDLNAGQLPANPHRKELAGALTWGV